MANKQALQETGAKFVELIQAVQDGFQMGEDLDEITALLVSLAAVAGDIGEDADSALLDILSGAASKFADIRREPEAVDGTL
jgi:hypothetical protein